MPGTQPLKKPQFLMMYFSQVAYPPPPQLPRCSKMENDCEGCCEVAGHYYAVFPRRKADNDYDMLLKLRCSQVWVVLIGDQVAETPAEDDWIPVP